MVDWRRAEVPQRKAAADSAEYARLALRHPWLMAMLIVMGGGELVASASPAAMIAYYAMLIPMALAAILWLIRSLRFGVAWSLLCYCMVVLWFLLVVAAMTDEHPILSTWATLWALVPMLYGYAMLAMVRWAS